MHTQGLAAHEALYSLFNVRLNTQPMGSKPTNEQLKAAIPAICKVIAQIPCFYVFETFIASRFSSGDTEQALRAVMHNASMDSTLTSLRAFNEFFTARSRPDDVRSRDFPGIGMQPFLPTQDAIDINKFLSHITTPRAGISIKQWPLYEMMILGMQHGIDFLSTIEITFPPSTKEDIDELHGVLKVTKRLIKQLEKQNERES